MSRSHLCYTYFDAFGDVNDRIDEEHTLEGTYGVREFKSKPNPTNEKQQFTFFLH